MYLLIQLLGATGFLLAGYAVWVSINAQRTGYRALCDLSDHVSCTRAFTDERGRLLGFHNATLGAIYYLLISVFALLELTGVLVLISLLGVVASAYLAYVSYWRMRNFCVVCTAVYLVNIALLVLSILSL